MSGWKEVGHWEQEPYNQKQKSIKKEERMGRGESIWWPI